MKVEVSHCAACGEKNSKWVQNCHSCGALLPWADGYQAPAPEPKTETPSQNAATSAVTVEVSPLENAAPAEFAPQIPALETPALETSAPSGEKPARKTPLYLGWAVAGVLGIACIALLMRGNSAPPMPAANNAAAPTANPTAQNLPVFPTSLPESAPPPIVNAPVINTPAPTNAPTFAPPISAARPGPSFEEVEANLTDSAQKFTDAQKQQYWNRVQNSRVMWRGAVVNVSSAGQGEIVLKCNPQSDGVVTIALDGSQLARLPALNKNQIVSIEGILQGHDAGNYQLAQGRILA